MVAPVKKPRRPNPTPDEKAERERLRPSRLEFICDRMRGIEWRWDSGKACAREWDLPEGYVRELTAEAAKIVRAEVSDPDRVLSKIAIALDHVVDTAIASGDRHAVIKAGQTLVQVLGLGAPHKVQFQQDLSALTPAQIQARKSEIRALLAAESSDATKGE